MLQGRRLELVESQVMISTVTGLMTDPPAAERAGADLRAARERLGMSLQDVALTLRIRLPHLEALEEGRISLLPGNAYALAFVRTYASAIGLDAEEMVRRFKTEAAAFSRRTELVFPVPMPERGMPAGAVMLLGLVLVAGAYAGWYRLSAEGRLPAETVTAIPERLAPLAEQALPKAPVAAADTGVPRIIVSGQPPAGILANQAPPVVSISPISAAAAQIDRPAAYEPAVPTVPAPAMSSSAMPSSAMPSPSMSSPGLSSPDAVRMVLRASADAWILVKDHAGTVLVNRTLKAGDTWPVPVRTDLLLTTGNAGGTEILVDGATTASLGGSGAVRRDLPLDPDQIRDGKLAIAAAAPQSVSARPHQ